MPVISQARKQLLVGVKPDLKKSPAELKLEQSTAIAREVADGERAAAKAKTAWLRQARLDAEKTGK